MSDLKSEVDVAHAVAASYLEAWLSTKAELLAAERNVEIGKRMLSEAFATIAELQAENTRLNALVDAYVERDR